MATLADIAEILGTDEKNVKRRIAGLKIGDTCSRCGGCGQYSYNQITGSTCFKCGGSGQQMPRDLDALMERAKACIADGTFHSYMENVRARGRCRNAMKQVFAAWHAVPAAAEYNKTWRNAAPKVAEINGRCCAAQEAFAKFATSFEFTPGPKDWTEYERQLKACLDVMAQATLEKF